MLVQGKIISKSSLYIKRELFFYFFAVNRANNSKPTADGSKYSA